MARQKDMSKFVVAREAIVVTVGARPIEYGKVTVIDRKTQEPVTIDNHNVIVDPGTEGMPYAFRAYQRVHKDHPAVLACPGGFVPADEVDEELILVA
jgi:hypothetical protein